VEIDHAFADSLSRRMIGHCSQRSTI
jgi:hypothetical protein